MDTSLIDAYYALTINKNETKPIPAVDKDLIKNWKFVEDIKEEIIHQEDIKEHNSDIEDEKEEKRKAEYELMKKATITPKEISSAIKNRPPKNYILSKFCNRCKKEFEKLNACSRCKMRYYCSKECQKNDWLDAHKTICGMIIDNSAHEEINKSYLTDQIIDIIFRLLCTIPRINKKADEERITYAVIIVVNEPYKKDRKGRYGCFLKLCTYSREEYSKILKKTGQKEDTIPEKTYLVQIRRLLREDNNHDVMTGKYYYINEETIFLLPTDKEVEFYRDKKIKDTEGKLIETLEQAFNHSFIIDGNIGILPKLVSAMSELSFVRYNPLPIPDAYMTIEESNYDKMKKRRDDKKKNK